MYDPRPAFGTMPPPPTAQHLPYNPKHHAAMANAGMAAIPPPRQSDAMSATYIPSGQDMYGEGVGIPGLGADESDMASLGMTDDPTSRDRFYNMAAKQAREVSNASSSSSVHAIPQELASQWSLDTVLMWLAQNDFSKQWQDTFKTLNLHGAAFLELGSRHAGRGNLGIMHKQVYPRLAIECMLAKTVWDQAKEREEGKRMRRLVRSIVAGLPVDPSQTVSSHARNNSVTSSSVSASNDPTESPNVSIRMIAYGMTCLLTSNRRR